MPPIRTARASKKAPPEGFDDIEDTLLEFQNKMKDAENASHEGKKKYEMTWPIFQITHQRSRYIYDLYYEKEAISKQLYDYLLKNGYADAMLIAKWKKQGYEKVCALRDYMRDMSLTRASSAAHDASRRRRPTSVQRVSAEYLANSSRRTRTSSASTVDAEDAHQATERRNGWVHVLEWAVTGKKNISPCVFTVDGNSMRAARIRGAARVGTGRRE
jgi:bud site selection protein 31